MRKRTSNAKDFGRVAVLYGGWSAERQVSLWSGKNVHEALVKKGVDTALIDATPQNVMSLAADGYDRAFIILHGGQGEDGTVQAALDLQGIPYAGSGVAASAIKLHKPTAKRIWKCEGLPTPDFAIVADEAQAAAAAQRFGFPCVIKPSAEGSSVGVTIVKNPGQVAKAFADARGDKDREVMCERFVKGAEMTVAILDDEALPSVRIVPAGEFYDYHAKYISDDTQYHCPSGVSPAVEKKLAEIAIAAFRLIGCRGWGRVDFLVDEANEQPYLLEINTLPGMTSHSLVPIAARARGVSFDDLCWAILETSL